MEVCDLPRVTLVALVNGDYREYPIDRDREFGALLLEAAQKWWAEFILTNTPPPVDGSDAYAAFIRRRYPRTHAPSLPASPELEALVSRFKETKGAFDQAKAFNDEAKQVLQAAIGEAEGIEGLCSWKNNKDGTSIDWEGITRCITIANHIPDGEVEILKKQFTTPTPGARVLRLTKEKKS